MGFSKVPECVLVAGSLQRSGSEKVRPHGAGMSINAHPALTCWAIYVLRLRRFGLRFAPVFSLNPSILLAAVHLFYSSRKPEREAYHSCLAVLLQFLQVLGLRFAKVVGIECEHINSIACMQFVEAEAHCNFSAAVVDQV